MNRVFLLKFRNHSLEFALVFTQFVGVVVVGPVFLLRLSVSLSFSLIFTSSLAHRSSLASGLMMAACGSRHFHPHDRHLPSSPWTELYRVDSYSSSFY